MKILLFGDLFPLPQLPSLKDALEDAWRCGTQHRISPADAVTPRVFRGPPWLHTQRLGEADGCCPRSPAAVIRLFLVLLTGS